MSLNPAPAPAPLPAPPPASRKYPHRRAGGGLADADEEGGNSGPAPAPPASPAPAPSCSLRDARAAMACGDPDSDADTPPPDEDEGDLLADLLGDGDFGGSDDEGQAQEDLQRREAGVAGGLNSARFHPIPQPLMSATMRALQEFDMIAAAIECSSASAAGRTASACSMFSLRSAHASRRPRALRSHARRWIPSRTASTRRR